MVVKRGTRRDDRLFGRDSADNLSGGQGNDVLYGFGGDDFLDGGYGNDRLLGGDGNDVLTDAYGRNLLLGGGGHDWITGGGDADTIDGGAGNDVIDAGDGNDLIRDLSGSNDIKAGGGNDRITTGSGADIIAGGQGADVISAGGGNDTIKGGQGNDRISGGGGDADIFVLSGSASNYVRIATATGWTIIDTRVSGSSDGTDHVAFDVEYFVFGNPADARKAPRFTIDAISELASAPAAQSLTLDEDAGSGPVSIGITGGDPELLSYSLQAGALPAHGTVTFDNAGHYTYTPDADYNGSDSFTIRMTSGSHVLVQTVSVTIDPVNDAPSVEDAGATTSETASVVVTLTASDIDGDTAAAQFSYELVGDAGPFTLDGDQLTFNPGSFYDDLAAGASTDVTVSYRALDQHGAASGLATVTVTVNGQNDSPEVAAVTADDVLATATSVSLTLLGADVDSDDDAGTLTYYIGSFATGAEYAAAIDADALTAVTETAELAIGDFQSLGEGASVTAQRTYVAVDQHGAMSNVGAITFSVIGVNDAPVLDVDVLDVFDDLGETPLDPQTYVLAGSFLADDPDSGDTLLFEVFASGDPTGVTVLNGTFGTLSVTAATGAWSYALLAGFDAAEDAPDGLIQESFGVRVADGLSLSDEDAFNITILFDPALVI